MSTRSSWSWGGAPSGTGWPFGTWTSAGPTGVLPWVETFDAVLSATALHWLGVEDLRSVALVLAERLRPGGVVVNYDTILSDGSAPRLARLAADLNEAAWEQADAAEDWTAWWDAARAEPEFAELLAERDRRFGHIEHGPGLTLEESVTAFTSAGFAEVGTVTQWADRRMLVAIR